jgi:arsenite-transporting ATPase
VTPDWLDGLTTSRLFFTGKGGVGKTSLACAAAVHAASQGRRTLIISTDPASNLDEVFGVALRPDPQPIPGVDGLWAANLDPEAAAAAYREKMVGPYRGKLPDAVIRGMEEQFSGACTTEIAAFDEFVRLMADPRAADEFDLIVFDTAPTGHTLRLLSLPRAWSGYLNTTTAESTCLGPLSGLQSQKALYESAFRSLANAEETTVVLVARPEPSSLREAARTQQELAELGICNLRLVVNSVYRPGATDDPLATAFAEAVKSGLESMPESLKSLPAAQVPMLGGNVVGLDAVRRLIGQSVAATAPFASVPLPPSLSFDDLVDDLAKQGHGVILTMGKGGVGKTSVAVKIARRLASRGESVLLTTTDPAGNLGDWATEGMEVARIDPAAEVAKYSAAAIEKASEIMDEDALELLREDLRSPCTEEIAVFRAFAEAVAQGEDRFVIIDTAPTGHTILLMDATEAYHREVARTQSDAPEAVRALLPRLRDPDFTRVVLVALPEPTPVHEAIHLAEDLRRAGIEPAGWVINRSFAATGPTEPILAGKAAQEGRSVADAAALGLPLAILPWTPDLG